MRFAIPPRAAAGVQKDHPRGLRDPRRRPGERAQGLGRRLAHLVAAHGRRLRQLDDLHANVRSEKLGEVADEFDHVHSVERAREVGSVHTILPAGQLRPWLVAAVERGMARARGEDVPAPGEA